MIGLSAFLRPDRGGAGLAQRTHWVRVRSIVANAGVPRPAAARDRARCPTHAAQSNVPRAFDMFPAPLNDTLSPDTLRGTRCAHRQLRDRCRICIARLSCPHGKVPSRCVACGGGGMCEHGRQRSQCVDCGGNGICVHKRIRSRCADCGGSGVCEHGRRRYRCRMCIENKAAREKAKGAFNIRAHFLGKDGNAAACAEDFHREDEPEPAEKEKRRRDSFWYGDDGGGARETREPPIPNGEVPQSSGGESSGEDPSSEEGRTSPKKNEGEEDRRAKKPKPP